MKRKLLFFISICQLFLFTAGALAQAPIISYSTPQVYTVGTAISTLSPSNSGGAVSGITYNTPSTTFATIAGTPYTVATDLAGNVYSVDESNGNLYKYTSAGVATTLNTTTLNNPVNIAIDPSGNIWVSDFGNNNVYKFNSAGALQSTITGFNQPYGIAFNSAGDAFIVDDGTGNIFKIASGTTTKTTYLSGFTSPYGIAIDGSGNMFVSQYTNPNNNIIKIAAGTTTKTTFATGFSGPRNMTTDAYGNVYVADYGNNAIKKITPTGTVTTFYTNGLSSVRDVSFDRSGNMFMANSGGNNLKKATPLGGYYISSNLPAGLSFDSATGNITGTPTAPQATTIYTITAYNGSGNGSTTVSITSNPVAPSVTPGSVCGSGAVTLTAGGSPTGGTYNWYSVATNGTVLQSSTSTTYSPTVSATTTYYVSYTSNGATSARTAVTATVNAAASSTFTATSAVVTNSNASITYTGTDPATSTYAWNFGGGTPSTGTGQGPFNVQWSTTGTKTITLTVTNAGGCPSTSTQTVTVGDSYSNYAFSRPVTLSTSTLGLTANLTNFPALLSIQCSDLIISGACTDKVYNPNGPNYDFAFIDPSSATELNYQVESYDQTTGTLLVWVKIPTLNKTTNNTLTFYYGSKTPPTTHNTAFFAATWPSDYLAVYHFNETAYTGTIADGTSNALTGTTAGMTSADLVSGGKIGSAYSFSSGKSIASTGTANITGAFTLSAWVNMTTGGLDQKIITNEGTAGGYKLGVYTTNIAEVETRNAAANPVTSRSANTGTALSTGTWYYVQGVWSGTKFSVYLNGALNYTYTASQNPTTGSVVRIGAEAAGTSGFNFNGLIDEPRISNVAKSADWVKAEYVDQNNPVAFTTVGSATATNSTNAAAISGALTYTWTGDISTDPTNANNWDNTTAGTTNQLPAFDGSAYLVIPAGLTNYPSLTANESLYGLTIANGASFNLNGFTLSVGCNIYNSTGGQILYGTNNSSGITWNGSMASQTYTGTNTASTAQLGTMTINNSAGGTVTISGGPVDIYKTLTITNGNLVVGAAPASLTLKSTATTSANVSAIPSGSSITGTVNVERYLVGGNLAHRGYRLLSSPVYSATVSSNNVYSINYLKNSMFLTSTSTSGGFDNTGAANPTLYLFRENLTPLYTTFLNSNFRGINNINSSPSYTLDVDGAGFNIPVGNGYLCFFRGNRASAAYSAETTTTYVPQAATLTASGTLNQGQITVKNWFTPASANLSFTSASPSTVKGYNLVGNPYASAIDWDTFQTATTTTAIYGTSISNTIWVLDPISHNYGAYVKGTGGVGTNNASNIISSGQGFFVIASSTAAKLIFNESAKTSTQATGSSLLMGKPDEQTANSQYLRLQLAADSVNTDDMLLRFNKSAITSFNPDLDGPYKLGMGKVSLASLSSDHMQLAINTRALPKTTDTIPLTVSATADGIYSLNMKSLVGVPQLYDIWLMDSYKKDSLDMRHNATYSFNVLKADTNTFGSKRFSLIIRQNTAYAYHLLDFTATKATTAVTNRQVQVTWKTENEQNYTNFTVERSIDSGKTFNVIASVRASGQGNYGFMDNDPISGRNLYRLKQDDINNTISYSKVIPVEYNNQNKTLVSNNINVYPNPANSTINLTISDVGKASTYNIMITNSSGLVIKQATATQATWQGNVSDLLPGSYVIKVINNKNTSVVGNTKFIKL